MNDFAVVVVVVVVDGGWQSIPDRGCLLPLPPLLRHVLKIRHTPSTFLPSCHRERKSHEVSLIDHTIGNLKRKENKR